MKQNLSPWKWVPTLYFAEGLPYVAVMVLSLVMYSEWAFPIRKLPCTPAG